MILMVERTDFPVHVECLRHASFTLLFQIKIENNHKEENRFDFPSFLVHDVKLFISL